jgi:hypothetical protein
MATLAIYASNTTRSSWQKRLGTHPAALLQSHQRRLIDVNYFCRSRCVAPFATRRESLPHRVCY